MALTAATYPKCEKRFRLVWRVSKRKLKPTQAIRLSCPHCENQFETAGVKLVIFNTGSENSPLTATVDTSCLVPSGQQRGNGTGKVCML